MQGVCVFCGEDKQLENHVCSDCKARNRDNVRAAETGTAREKHQRELERERQRQARAADRKQQAQIDADQEKFNAKDAAVRERARRELSRRHLLPFIKKFNPDYLAGWVHKDICVRLEKFTADVAYCSKHKIPGPRLIIAMPPRSGKSEIASRCFPAWYLGQNPGHEIIAASYSSALAIGFSRKVKETIREDTYTQIYPEIKLHKDAQANENWMLDNGSQYAAVGTGGPITGRGAHCLKNNDLVTVQRTGVGAYATINQVRVGDKVLAYDHHRQKTVWAEVLAVSAGRKPELIEVNGVHCTPDHKFYTRGRGYVRADELTPADDLVEMPSLSGGVRAHDEAARTAGTASRLEPYTTEDLLLSGLRAGWQTYWAQQDLPEMRWDESSARQHVRALLSGVANRLAHDCDVRELREILSAASQRAGETNPQAWQATQDVLQSRLLRDVPAQTPDYYCGVWGVRELREIHGAQWPEVLFACVLSRCAPQSAPGTAEVFRDVSRRQDAEAAEGYGVQTVPVESTATDAPHRPQPGQQPAEQFTDAVPEVPYVVSQQRGVCAADLEGDVRDTGGELVTDIQTTVGNFAAGRRRTVLLNCLILDDLFKNREEAESEVTRQSVWDWYTSTAYTRLAPGGGIVAIGTMWHDDDILNRLIEKSDNGSGDKWEVVRYPAIATEDETYRRKGDALHPERYPLETLENIKRAVGPRDWQALYQQNPVAEDGDYFTRDMFRYYDRVDLPSRDDMRVYAAWDLAIGQKQTNDYTVGLYVGIDRADNIYILHVERGRWDSYAIVERLLDLYRQFEPIVTGIEKGHIEMAIGPFLDKRIQETRTYMYYEPLTVGRADKQARAQSIRGRMRQGKVLFDKTDEGQTEMINEMLRFPNGKHDDTVDAIAHIGQMFDGLVGPGALSAPKPKPGWRDKLKSLQHGKKSVGSSPFMRA